MGDEKDKSRLREVLLAHSEGSELAAALDNLLATARKEEREAAFKEARRRVYMIPGSVSVDPAVRKGFAAGVNAAIEVIAALEATENRKGGG